jgi:hypothetical protein
MSRSQPVPMPHKGLNTLIVAFSMALVIGTFFAMSFYL